MRVTHDGASAPYVGARWSPDGRYLAAERSGPTDAGSRLALVRRADGASEIISPPGQYVDGYAWSPDGRYVAYAVIRSGGTFAGGTLVGGIGEVRLYDRESRTDRRLADGVHPSFTPDGSLVGYVDPSGTITLVSIDGATRRALADTTDMTRAARAVSAKGIGVVGGPLWSQSGRYVAFAALERGPVQDAHGILFVMTMASGSIRAHQLGPAGALHHVADLRWSPAGDQLAYALIHADPHHHALGLVDASQQSSRLLYESRPHFLEFTWSPDGRLIVLALDDENAWLVLRPDVSEVVTRTAPGGWRPDWCWCP